MDGHKEIQEPSKFNIHIIWSKIRKNQKNQMKTYENLI